MKLIRIFSILAILFSLTFIAQSCKKDDPCEEVVCQNGGSCDDGICEGCDIGYEGGFCSILSRAKLLGDYSIIQECGAASISYDGIISAHPDDDLKFYISYDTGTGPSSQSLQYELIMIGKNTFNLPSQTPCTTCFTVGGSGSIDSDSGIVTLNMTFDGISDTCIFTFTPQ